MLTAARLHVALCQHASNQASVDRRSFQVATPARLHVALRHNGRPKRLTGRVPKLPPLFASCAAPPAPVGQEPYHCSSVRGDLTRHRSSRAQEHVTRDLAQQTWVGAAV